MGKAQQNISYCFKTCSINKYTFCIIIYLPFSQFECTHSLAIMFWWTHTIPPHWRLLLLCIIVIIVDSIFRGLNSTVQLRLRSYFTIYIFDYCKALRSILISTDWPAEQEKILLLFQCFSWLWKNEEIIWKNKQKL